MTTRIQPFVVDTTANYSMNQLSANTVVANGVNLITLVNAAYAQANTATLSSFLLMGS